MRKITEIIIHCSATPEGGDYTVADIDRWYRARGFHKIRFHFVIYRDGSIHVGRAKNVEPIAQVRAPSASASATLVVSLPMARLRKTPEPRDRKNLFVLSLSN